MPIRSESAISHIGILEDGQLQIRRSRRVYDTNDRLFVAEQYHRHVLAPGDNTTAEDARVRAVAAAVWTPQVIQAYRDAQRARNLANTSE